MPSRVDRLRASLADRYLIEKDLDSGAMSLVFLAEDIRHHRQVAIKVFRPEIAGEQGAARFMREIETVAGLSHPHILPLYDSGESAGLLYYVMPLVEGESLRDRLSREGQLTPEAAVAIMIEIADALAYAHAHGVIHRDIKPDNVMLTEHHALVTDFGVAKAIGGHAGSLESPAYARTAWGTPAYMAPEQVRADGRPDQRVDIYALGVLMYEALTGGPPLSALLLGTDAPPAEPVARLRAGVSPELSAVVAKCLEPDPDDRWQSAEEMLTHLRTLPTAEPLTLWKAASQHPLLSAGALVAGLAALSVGAQGLLGSSARFGTDADALTPVWLDRSGEERVIDRAWTMSGTETGTSFALSPDGSRLAIGIPDADGNFDLWVKTLDTGPLNRLTFEGAANRRPTWSPDGATIMFVSNRGGDSEVWERGADGGSAAAPVWGDERQINEAVRSPDQDWLLFRQGSAPADVYGVRLGVDSVATPLLDTRFNELEFSLSPDGRWLVYRSDESGRPQVYVSPFPDVASRRWQVSTGGAREPVWAHSGNEIFYRNVDDELVAAQVSADSTFRVIGQRVLFSTLGYLRGNGRPQYDVAPDDDGFLMLRMGPPGETGLMDIAYAWVDAVKARLSTSTPSSVSLTNIRQVTRAPGVEYQPAISPDGSEVAYVVGFDAGRQIVVQDLASGQEVLVTADRGGAQRRPRWTNDGLSVSFHEYGPDVPSSSYVVPPRGGAARKIVDGFPIDALRGDRFVYIDSDGIRLGSLSGGSEEPIANTSSDSHSTVWSPDLERLAYVRGNPAFVSVGNVSPSSIWTVGLDGAGDAQITDQSSLNTSPAWMPDGRGLMFISDRDGVRDMYVVRLDPAGRPRGEPVRVTSGMEPHTISISEDGSTLAYSRLTFRRNVWEVVLPTTGSVSFAEARQVTTGNQTVEQHGLSRDGQLLAYDTNRDGNQDIYVVSTEGGEPVRLTRDPGDDFHPDFSTDGSEVVFYSQRHGSRDLFLINIDGSNETRLTDDPGSEYDPAFSPDALAIVFRGNLGIQVIRRDSVGGAWGEPRVLARGEHPRWSPTGERVVYEAGTVIEVVTLAGETSRVFDGPSAGLSGRYWPDWSPDGASIYLFGVDASGVRALYSVPVGGGEHRQHVRLDDPSKYVHLAFSLGVGKVYLSVAEYESDIYIADIEVNR